MIPPEEPLLKPYVCDCGRRTDDLQNSCHGDAKKLEERLAEKEAEIERLKARESFLIQKDLALDKLQFQWREKIEQQAEVIRIAREATALGKWLSEKALAGQIDMIDLQEVHCRFTNALDKMNQIERKK